MLSVDQGTSVSIPFGLEFVLIFAALTFVVLVVCVVPVVFEIRRHVLRSAAWAEAMKWRADRLLDECRRTARVVGDSAARMSVVPSSRSMFTTFFKAMLGSYR
jgi:hypothetical protein